MEPSKLKCFNKTINMLTQSFIKDFPLLQITTNNLWYSHHLINLKILKQLSDIQIKNTLINFDFFKII
jgi:hypothetical protein